MSPGTSAIYFSFVVIAAAAVVTIACHIVVSIAPVLYKLIIFVSVRMN